MKRKTSVRHLIPGLITVGLSVFVLAVVASAVKDRQSIKTQAATDYSQCPLCVTSDCCSRYPGCYWTAFNCSSMSDLNCLYFGCHATPIYTSCNGKDPTTCQSTEGCTPIYNSATYNCSNSNCPSGCTKKPIYSACNTSTCNTSGCSCSTSYSCTGPYYCSGLSYSSCTSAYNRSRGCGWSSRTSVSGSYLSGSSCTGTYTNRYYSYCSGQYVIGTQCSGIGNHCVPPTQ